MGILFARPVSTVVGLLGWAACTGMAVTQEPEVFDGKPRSSEPEWSIAIEDIEFPDTSDAGMAAVCGITALVQRRHFDEGTELYESAERQSAYWRERHEALVPRRGERNRLARETIDWVADEYNGLPPRQAILFLEAVLENCHVASGGLDGYGLVDEESR